MVISHGELRKNYVVVEELASEYFSWEVGSKIWLRKWDIDCDDEQELPKK